VPPCSLTKEVSIFESLVELPQLTVLEMKTLFWAQQTWLWQRIADGREFVTPHTRPLLPLEKRRFHEEMTADYGHKVRGQTLHQPDSTAVVIMGQCFQMVAKLCGIFEMTRFCVVWLFGRSRVK
jgi:hypothetical protein